MCNATDLLVNKKALGSGKPLCQKPLPVISRINDPCIQEADYLISTTIPFYLISGLVHKLLEMCPVKLIENEIEGSFLSCSNKSFYNYIYPASLNSAMPPNNIRWITSYIINTTKVVQKEGWSFCQSSANGPYQMNKFGNAWKLHTMDNKLHNKYHQGCTKGRVTLLSIVSGWAVPDEQIPSERKTNPFMYVMGWRQTGNKP